ncbi:MAG: hypothetical protein LIO67_04875 [Lachnospiraceae bacterium]|nr:hypothetical protein [Lachnospiraceae bacterium]
MQEILQGFSEVPDLISKAADHSCNLPEYPANSFAEGNAGLLLFVFRLIRGLL